MIKKFKINETLIPFENGFIGISLTDKVKENTNTFNEGFNGDYFYNTIYKFIGNTGDITSYDFKVLFSTHDIKIGTLPQIKNIPDNVDTICVSITEENIELVNCE